MDNRFAHVCLIVHDIEKSIEDYRSILAAVDPKQLEEPIVYYADFGVGEERLAFATFPSTGCEIQLMQPKTPGTPLYERLQKRGEHVHHICFTATRVEDLVAKLAHEGVGIVPQGVVTDPQLEFQRWTFVDPKRSHGVLIELANHYKSVDSRWEQADDAVEA
jgi:methylmalonyl-CoA/ethylmalonyl-CoA epimerase